jgi:DNA-binding NarL/FixJ family response regulator
MLGGAARHRARRFALTGTPGRLRHLLPCACLLLGAGALIRARQLAEAERGRRDAEHAVVGERARIAREVLTLIATGMSNAEIAGTLVLSTETVKTYVSRILAKLGLRDRVQAVVLAYQVGLVSAQD